MPGTPLGLDKPVTFTQYKLFRILLLPEYRQAEETEKPISGEELKYSECYCWEPVVKAKSSNSQINTLCCSC